MHLSWVNIAAAVPMSMVARHCDIPLHSNASVSETGQALKPEEGDVKHASRQPALLDLHIGHCSRGLTRHASGLIPSTPKILDITCLMPFATLACQKVLSGHEAGSHCQRFLFGSSTIAEQGGAAIVPDLGSKQAWRFWQTVMNQ